ncbi:unnamed protein product [Cuscuta epithymum]|uniref:Uncharacterized protein n=1 Tax=Cuscuta epithymum TaxID=186058 RepID=A0AAV0C790_9ASTE|nr:unnamed protein product [Cuscuta epithymum]
MHISNKNLKSKHFPLQILSQLHPFLNASIQDSLQEY